MEAEIARLLEQFERGTLTRRQLIQSLATVALAVPAAATVSAQTPAAAMAEKAPWKTVWLDHISYAVTDYKKSAAFYSNLMGWEVRNDNGTNQATLNIGNIGQIIIRNRRQPDTTTAPPGGASPSAAGAGGQAGRPGVTGVINHISFGIEPWDTDKVKAELERRGLNPRPDMQGENFKSFHVLDPDGWDLQISNQTKND